jgi:hypothetical protein
MTMQLLVTKMAAITTLAANARIIKSARAATLLAINNEPSRSDAAVSKVGRNVIKSLNKRVT